eukprot:TRINITY_DN1351_c1_g1_i1.p1 TRINITY_DN1351_c1_g1~~TRINITY_DN1351_c1_g1_i1.p1  ORF type:complete len:302 (+),score=44.73 TRINITY_DN1351_c1_g1_i1:213-1118(+)
MKLLHLVLLMLSGAPSASGKVISALVMPHGDFVYDPSLVDNKNGSKELHTAAVAAGKWLDEQQPDLIVLSTPHGLELDEKYLYYLNQNETGFAELGDDLHNSSFQPYRVYMNVSVAVEETLSLVNSLPPSMATGIKGFAGGMTLPISWGEIIPLSFVNKRNGLIILGQPLKRYNHSVEMMPQLLLLGQQMFKHLDALPQRVSIIISSDLAHTHLASGPYGYCPCAEPYDTAVGKWASTLDRDYLINNAASEQQAGAMSCGFTGLVMLQGMFDSSEGQWTSSNLANYHPTYYGMMVANFTRT